MKYNKLVRDNIPEIIRKKGGMPIFHVAEDMEYWQKLLAKLLEEFTEFKADESLEEFADILEVVEAIALYKKFDQKIIEQTKVKKAEERGKFNKRIILDES